MAGKVVIIGGGLVGCETADFLAQTSDNFSAAPTEVTILEMWKSKTSMREGSDWWKVFAQVIREPIIVNRRCKNGRGIKECRAF